MLGGYRLEALVGAGTSGEVWQGRPAAGGEAVAIKRVTLPNGPAAERARARTAAEAQVLAALHHPNIVELLDVVVDRAGVAIVMPLAVGGSLADRLSRPPRLSPPDTVAVLAPVADALAATHRCGLVHGDVKPANILFAGDGTPWLSDFGASNRFWHGPTGRSAIAGTAPYLDPALLDHPEPSRPGPASDVYAFGVVCYEALSGTLPYDGTDAEILAAAHAGRHRPLTDLVAIPAPLAHAVERAIARQPSDRPATMDELAVSLRNSVEPGSGASSALGAMPSSGRPTGRHGTHEFGPRPPAPGPDRRPTHPARRRLIAVGALCAATVALAAIGWSVRERQEPAVAGPRSSRPPRPSCPRYPDLPVRAGAAHLERFRVDLNGDGCAVPVTWDGRILTARFAPHDPAPRYYEIGSQGDVLLFGDWDCDHVQTPALYRPGRGEVIYSNAFAGRLGATSGADRIARGVGYDGTAHVVDLRNGCESVQVSRRT